jgi:hypothetical protein
MGWFNKKEKVPELPSAPVLPELPKTTPERALPDLPSFPVNPQTTNLNQEIVKSAVSDLPSGENEDATKALEGLHVEEVGGGAPMLPSIPVSSGIPEPPKKISIKDMKPSIELPLPKKAIEIPTNYEEKSLTKSIEPIFVRIDKFQSAQKDFDVIKDKIKEIESVIRKIKDVKSKEEQELNEWSEEIDKLKSRLAEIDSNVFSQM